ncbi:copper chaperone PCu(A)C [Arthrobacter sp. NPDC090010]|uniref:copper chaperone PCu(A)C n=1 Tax=Arthrobacter sp. NPDC090010 TaxID=3363942 RepID=UPI0037FA836D
MTKKTNAFIISAASAALLALSACTPPSTADAGSTTQAASALSISEPWVKAAPSGMTAAFGVVKNSSGKELTVVSVATPASAMAELHETVMSANGGMQMRAKEGGFTIPAGGALTLEPGGNHIMLMKLNKAYQAGDEIPFELKTSDGEVLSFTAQVKDFSGAKENYAPGHGDHSGHGTPTTPAGK